MVRSRAILRLVTLILMAGGLATQGGAQIARPPGGAGVGGVTPGPINPGPINPGPETPGPTAPGGVTPPPLNRPVGPPPIPPQGPGTQPVKQLSYYIVINGQQAGPFDNAGLAAKVASGELVRSSLVWTEGMANWEAASKVPDLIPILSSVPPKAQFDAMAYLSGTWQADPTQMQIPNIGPGTSNSRTTYRRDGTYTYLGTLDAMMIGGMARQTITSDGTFTAQEQGPGKVLITPNGMIKFSMPGEQTQTAPNNTPFVMTILDDNTMASDDGVRSRRVGW